MRCSILAVLIAAASLAPCGLASAQTPVVPSATVAGAPANAGPARKPRGLTIANKPWKGDFDEMLERRMLRIYAPYSRSLYFSDKGRERGISVDLARDWERYLNKKYAKQLGKRPLTVYIGPATRDKLLPYLDEGLSDVSIGNLTVTDARLQQVDFVPGNLGRRTINEIVATGPQSPEVKVVADLSGKQVHVRKASSYHESLVALNETLQRDGKPPVELVLVPEALEDEDMLDMLNAGLLQFIVIDDWKARMWAPLLPKLRAHEDLVLRAGATTGWAIRKDSPLLKAEIADFFESWVARTGVADYRMKTYAKRARDLKDPTGSTEWRRFKGTIALFEKYGARYDFEPLMLAAQGYQESQLDQQAKSAVGAIGVMQIMPAAGAQLGVGDIRQVEPNIHAGAKYMDQLMSKYFPDANFSPGNRPLFAFASYNCGPGNVANARRIAAQRGLDPDKWFNNVEVVIADRIGTETTTYVRNIYKYYVAYTLALEAQEAAEKARGQVTPARR